MIAAEVPVSQAEMFGEAFGVVPIVHTPPNAQKALAIGNAASALLFVAGRYPFTDLVYAGDDAPASIRQPTKADKRLRVLAKITDLPSDWKADVIAIAAPGLPDATVAEARKHADSGTVVVIAVDRYSAGGVAKRLLEKYWRVVVPYREFLPTPQLYFLASDTQLSRKRPVPGWTRRLSEGYMPALFRFPKDEHAALYSTGARIPA